MTPGDKPPARPDQPAHPGQPAQPAQAALPGQPGQPGRPAATRPMVTRWRVALGVAGVAAAGYGGWGLLTGGNATAPPDTARWLLGGVVGHDLLIAPLVAGVGWLVARTVPAVCRPTVHGGLFVAGSATLIAVPVLSGRGGRSNPTTNPLDYPRNLLLLLAAIAVVTAVLAAVQARRGRTAQTEPTDRPA